MFETFNKLNLRSRYTFMILTNKTILSYMLQDKISLHINTVCKIASWSYLTVTITVIQSVNIVRDKGTVSQDPGFSSKNIGLAPDSHPTSTSNLLMWNKLTCKSTYMQTNVKCRHLCPWLVREGTPRDHTPPGGAGYIRVSDLGGGTHIWWLEFEYFEPWIRIHIRNRFGAGIGQERFF